MTDPQYYKYRKVELREGYLFGIESFVAIRAEVDPLLTQQWRETEAIYKDGEPDPDYFTYTKYEERGAFHFFTARSQETRRLVGYLATLIGPGLHEKSVVRAREQAFYVAPDWRTGHVGIHLLDYAERALQAFGAEYLDVSSKEPAGAKDLAPLMKRRHYTPHSVVYTKKLGD